MAKKKIKNIFEDYEVKWEYIRGTANWVYLLEPDDYDNWSLNLYGDQVDALEEDLQEYLDTAVEFVKEQGKEVTTVAPIYNVDQEGKKFFKLKKKKYDENTPKPKIYNVSGDEVTDSWNKPIGAGSVVRVKVMIKPYYIPATKTVGLSKRLLAVQIIKNETFGGDAGFKDESNNGDTPPFEVEESDSEY